MYRKEEASYGILAVFIIASALLIILMLPFEPITTYAVFNQTYSAQSAQQDQTQSGVSNFVDFVMQNYLLIIVVFVIFTLALVGMIFLIMHKKHADETLSGISPQQLEGLSSYIKSTMAQGYTKEQVKKALIDAGWQEKVSEAILSKF